MFCGRCYRARPSDREGGREAFTKEKERTDKRRYVLDEATTTANISVDRELDQHTQHLPITINQNNNL